MGGLQPVRYIWGRGARAARESGGKGERLLTITLHHASGPATPGWSLEWRCGGSRVPAKSAFRCRN